MRETISNYVTAFKGDKRKWFPFAGSKIILPEASPDLGFFLVSKATDKPELSCIPREEALKALAGAQEAKVLVLRKAPIPLALSFTSVLKDEDGNKWDVLVNGACSICNMESFLNRYGIHAVTPEMPISRVVMEAWTFSVVQPRLGDALGDVTISDLRDKNVLPATWWEIQFNKWFSERGIAFKDLSVEWKSADAARAEEERVRKLEMERIEQERNLQLEAELREAQVKACYEEEKARIERDKLLSDTERTHQLQVLELSHRKELLDAETGIENARRKAEQSALEHEVAIALLRHDLESARKAETRMSEVQNERATFTEVMAKATILLKQLGGISEPLLQQLAGKDSRQAYQAAERLSSPEFNISASTLATLGFGVEKQALVQRLANKQSCDAQAVQLLKLDFIPRDIGTAIIKALPIGRSLQFEFNSRRAGYATLLNLGTSGNVYLQVPNAMIGGQNVRVVSDKSYFVPGRDLFPWDGDYREEGPGGWEHIVGIVSDEPVIPQDILFRSTPDSPIVRLTAEEVSMLFAQLEELSPTTWSAGVLSFLVGG